MTHTFEHGYAVVVGVNENQIGRLALETVAKDVQFLYEVLVHPERCAYKPANVKLLKGAESTGKNILDALYWLQDKVKADPEATAVVYYSGHGMVDQAANQYYLIPYDMKALNRVRADAIKAESLTAEISAIPAKRMLVILDCCHAAGMDAKDVDLSTAVEEAAFPIDLPETKDIPDYTAEPGGKEVSDLAEGAGRAILNSSTGDQSSYIRNDGQMSLFTYHLIEALTGHAPHPDDATVVLVTDVMSWVTHEVKKSARNQGVEQTPVMKTSGVFPIAQLIGGKGVAIAKGEIPPAPLEPLPLAATTVTFNQQGQTVGGHQANIGTMQGNIGQIGDTVGGDKITTGNISGTGIAIGRESSANVQIQQGLPADQLAQLFAPLLAAVAQQNASAVTNVQALQAEVERGEDADDERMADLIGTIAEAAPTAVEALVNLFTNSVVAKIAGAATKYVLKRIRR